jgi:amino acid transporter
LDAEWLLLQESAQYWLDIRSGGAIGAGLFVGSAGAFQNGGPASVLLGFMIIGESVAMAIVATYLSANNFSGTWEYAISWLTVLPFEISAACGIIHYWQGSEGINNAAWIVPLLVLLVVIQFFGVKGYGEVWSAKSYKIEAQADVSRLNSSSVSSRLPPV